MCGVAGHAGPARVAASAARSCLERLGRRGPDHAAWKSWSGPRGVVELGHTRLSIIDLDPRSHQPFYREGLWVAFNGEIYNHFASNRNQKHSRCMDTEFGSKQP
jgi:asparagine synthase (glutamine-hydrolysing)